MPRVVSVLHHPIPATKLGRIAEEDELGWHFRSSKALVKYSGYRAIAVRPSGDDKALFKLIDEIPVVLTPSINLSPSLKIWKWSHVSIALAKFVGKAVKQGYIPYIHEYRALNSELVVRRIIDNPMILQHHGSLPPCKLTIGGFLNTIKELNKRRRDSYLRRVRGFFFVLNKYEEHYLNEVLNVDAKVIVRTMAVDFNKFKPLNCEEKANIRESIGLRNDEGILITYVGVFGEEFSHMKGAHYLLKIWRELKLRLRGKVKMIVSGVGEPYLSVLRRAGVIAYKLLSHREYVRLVSASDIYFLPATSSYLYGGISVAVMEAMALGIPIVSPTLREFPDPNRVKDIGVVVRWVDDESSLREFIDALIYTIENRDYYKPWVIRELDRKYYSWESFVSDFTNAVRRL